MDMAADGGLKKRLQNMNTQNLHMTPQKIKTKNLDTIPVMSMTKGFIQFPDQNQNIMVQT